LYDSEYEKNRSYSAQIYTVHGLWKYFASRLPSICVPLSGVLVQILNYTRKVEIVAFDRIFLGKVLDRA
jgi:hypothetical protein